MREDREMSGSGSTKNQQKVFLKRINIFKKQVKELENFFNIILMN